MTIEKVEYGAAIFLLGTEFTIGISCHRLYGQCYQQLQEAMLTIAYTEQNHITQFKMACSTWSSTDGDIEFGLGHIKHLVEQHLPGVIPLFRRTPEDEMWDDAAQAAEYTWTMDRQGIVTESFYRPQLRAANYPDEPCRDRFMAGGDFWPAYTRTTTILDDNMFTPLV